MRCTLTRRTMLLLSAAAATTAFVRRTGAEPPPAGLPVSQLAVETAKGRFPFVVEVAATPEHRQQGLMHRRELPAWGGMLFDFERPQPVAMWMKNTLISLDMLFLDAQGGVVYVAENTQPLSLQSITAPVPVLAVLELNAGTAARLGVRVGDRVLHPMFRGSAGAEGSTGRSR